MGKMTTAPPAPRGPRRHTAGGGLLSLRRGILEAMRLAVDDVVLLAELEVTPERWRTDYADVLLELEENLTRQARDRGRELRDLGRHQQVTHLRRRRYLDVATGRRREYLEQVTAADGYDLVRILAGAPAYRAHP